MNIAITSDSPRVEVSGAGRGLRGATGATGLTGPTGATGAAGENANDENFLLVTRTTIVVDSTAALAWENQTDYFVGDFVSSGGTNYVCILQHESAPSGSFSVGSNWTALSATNDPSGTYGWTPAENAFILGNFKIFKNEANSFNAPTIWYLYESGNEIARRSDRELVGGWECDTYGLIVDVEIGSRSLFFSGVVNTSAQFSELLNESAYGDEFHLGRGTFSYSGLLYNATTAADAPGNNLGSVGADAIGNHKGLPGNLVIKGVSQKDSTIKLVQEVGVSDMRRGGLIIPALNCGGKIELHDLTVDANAYANISTCGALTAGTHALASWDWDWVDPGGNGPNWELNPTFFCFYIEGENSILRDCRFIGWTAGGCNVDLTGAKTNEQVGNGIYAYDCIVDGCLFEEPVDVGYTYPYGNGLSCRFNTHVRNTTVRFPDTEDDYWVLGKPNNTYSAAQTFAFGIHDNCIMDGNRAYNCYNMYHRDTLGMIGCVIKNSSCRNVGIGVLLNISHSSIIRNLVVSNNTFEIRDMITPDESGGFVTVRGAGIKLTLENDETVVRGVTIENNTVIGTSEIPGYEYGYLLKDQRETGNAIEDISFRKNISGVWNGGTGNSRLLIEKLQSENNQVPFDPWNYDSNTLDLGYGGTSQTTVLGVRESLGLTNLFLPTTDSLYGALWNNAGVVTIGTANADTTAYVARLNAVFDPTAWITATNYAEDDWVTESATTYRCVTAHTSSALFATDSANWSAETRTVTDQQISFIDAFIRREIAAGRDNTVHHRVYLPIWGDEAANEIPIWNSGSAGTFGGTVTHSSGYVQGDGSTGYFNTGIRIGIPADGLDPGLGFSESNGCMWALTLPVIINGSHQLGTYCGTGDGTRQVIFREQSTQITEGTYVYGGAGYGPYNVFVTGPSQGIMALNRYVKSGNETASGVTGGAIGTTIMSRRGATGYYPYYEEDIEFLFNATTKQPLNSNGPMLFMGRNTTGATNSVAPSGFSKVKFGGFGLCSGLDKDDLEDFTLNFKNLWENITGLKLDS